MKNNLKTFLIVLLAALLISSLLVVAACTTDPVTVTLTVDYGLDGVENQVITVDVGKPFVNRLVLPTSEYIFGGWYMDGEQVTSSTVAPKHDFTVTVKWRVVYRVEYYREKLTTEGEYDLYEHLDAVGELGSTVTAEAKTINGYTFDENNAANVKSAVLNGTGVTLKMYYNRAIVTVNFDKLISSATGSMQPITGKYGATVTLPHVGFSSSYTFLGWNTAANGSGTPSIIQDGADFTLNGNVTLYAQWEGSYTIECYKEAYVGDTFETEYVKAYSVQNTGIIGRGISIVASNPDASKYVLDEEKSEMHGVLTEDTTFVTYFKLRTFTIRYLDDNTVEYAKYGSNYTVRTPERKSESYYVYTYNTTQSGNGREYAFGSTITDVREDYVLYPMIVDVYMDDSGSGDTLEIYRNKTGYGSATLVRGDDSYVGRKVTDKQDYAAFEVTVDDEQICGRYYDLSGFNWFIYRGDEYGTYMYYDYIVGDGGIDATVLLALDGYGMGVIMMPANDGTERFISYVMEYAYDESNDEYNTNFPNGEFTNVHFRLVKQSFEGYEDYAGYYMLWNIDGEYYRYVWYDNQSVYEVYMYLDGYGNAEVYKLNANGDTVWSVTGKYYGSNYYLEGGELEYRFYSDNDAVFSSCYFTLSYISYGDKIVYVFLTKNAEYGVYTAEGASFPELYLDGYGGALYTASSGDEGRYGNYQILNPNSDSDSYNVVVRFYDDIGGAMLVEIVVTRYEDNMAIGTFTVQQGGFIVDENGVLNEYIYDGTVGPASVIVIPEQVNGVTVKEIAANVFNGFNITSVTFPATLEKIGDYAFSNGNFNDASALRTVIFLGSNPPELGKDVFRWIKGSSLRIIVPDGAGDAYRNAPSWNKEEDSQKDGYAKFVVTQYELDNKPLYEIKDGVLVSYNNKEDNPQNVTIEIPAEATEIADGVFFNLSYIVSVNLNNVTVIGNNAFYGCINLATVVFNPATDSIGDGAFYSCVSLTSVDLGNVRVIGAEAFSRCLALNEVVIGSRIVQIGDYAFFECSRTEEVVTNPDGDPNLDIELFDLNVYVYATTAPAMGRYVFQGTQARVYVADYDTAVSYVTADTWSTYGKYLYVKADGISTWYSKSNTNGWKLTLSDNLIFDDNYTGWYKWDGNTLYVTWYQYSILSNTVKVISQKATLVNGELIGLSLDWDEGVDYVFVQEGTTLTYINGSETLAITFGANYALFNGSSVKLETYGYRMQFSYEGYVYTVTLVSNGSALTFSYDKSKITVAVDYVAEDGSTLTIFYGNYNSANGRLLNVNGGEIYTETRGWYLTMVSNNVYSFKLNHNTLGNLLIIITLHDDNTFSYTWSIDSVVTVYRNASTGDVAIVTRSTTTDAVSITVIFHTSNGSQSQVAEITAQNGNVFTIVIDGTVDVEMEDGTVYQEPSAFNGTYTLTLVDGDNPSFTLQKI